MPVHLPTGRSVILIEGEDAEHFLQNLVTCDLGSLQEGVARAGALLAPQGKVLFDFLIFRVGADAFMIDIRSDVAADFIRRLTLYKLRAKVEIGESEESLVAISWENDSSDIAAARAVRDSRFVEEIGVTRHYGDAISGRNDKADAWNALRVSHGVAESGPDFALGEAFPHDISLDQNDGVDFRKGCYVGQEVVSRMQHRGTARRRIVIVESAEPLPAPGTAIETGGKPVGTLGTVAGERALAIVRLDRARDAREKGMPIVAGDTPVELTLPRGVSYDWPNDTAAADD
ncbi:YgfZ/GcvT domain-containing protein [Oricola cellulosilytica]|uniref:Folate-binding protein n=1 Tax=Oricola cellulosilytica TaxID=1429082 RepID=A0A4R0PAI7_9HYPH|nr:folate-binding protein YgfZ [Oricola cellulosilytica]TCD14262.1 folate-binding protein [Oricola cellulosilytica]